MNYDWFRLINDWAGRRDWMDDIMELCAQDIVWLMLAILAVLWLTGKAGNQKAVFFSCLSAAVALLIASLLISPEVNHPRPFAGHVVHQLIPHAPDPSFPSDHATLAFSLAFGILFAKRRRIGSILFVLAVLTGFARVYVGVHYPGDILGAMALSLLVSLAVWKSRHRMDALPRFFIRIYGKLTGRLTFLPRP